MNHLNEDILLKRVLHLLGDKELSEQNRHLSGCPVCKAMLAKIEQETEFIGSLEPEIDRPRIPLPNHRIIAITRLMKIAALLIIGFIAGYSVSGSTHPTVITVIPHQVNFTPELHSLTGFTTCE